MEAVKVRCFIVLIELPRLWGHDCFPIGCFPPLQILISSPNDLMRWMYSNAIIGCVLICVMFCRRLMICKGFPHELELGGQGPEILGLSPALWFCYPRYKRCLPGETALCCKRFRKKSLSCPTCVISYSQHLKSNFPSPQRRVALSSRVMILIWMSCVTFRFPGRNGWQTSKPKKSHAPESPVLRSGSIRFLDTSLKSPTPIQQRFLLIISASRL